MVVLLVTPCLVLAKICGDSLSGGGKTREREKEKKKKVYKNGNTVKGGMGGILLAYEAITTGSFCNILDGHCAVVLEEEEKERKKSKRERIKSQVITDNGDESAGDGQEDLAVCVVLV